MKDRINQKIKIRGGFFNLFVRLATRKRKKHPWGSLNAIICEELGVLYKKGFKHSVSVNNNFLKRQARCGSNKIGWLEVFFAKFEFFWPSRLYRIWEFSFAYVWQ